MGVCIVQEKTDPSLRLPSAAGLGMTLVGSFRQLLIRGDAKYKVTRGLLKPSSHSISVEQTACRVADYGIDCRPS